MLNPGHSAAKDDCDWFKEAQTNSGPGFSTMAVFIPPLKQQSVHLSSTVPNDEE